MQTVYRCAASALNSIITLFTPKIKNNDWPDITHPPAERYLAISPHFSVNSSSSFIIYDTRGKVGFFSWLHIPDVNHSEKKERDLGHLWVGSDQTMLLQRLDLSHASDSLKDDEDILDLKPEAICENPQWPWVWESSVNESFKEFPSKTI